jgi:tetratricopeptide (TPR) repeat protein
VLRLVPGRADTAFARGTAYFSAGEYRAAVADFNKTIELGRADPTVLYLRDLAESEIRNRFR